MSQANFTIAYDGPALRGGTMDVRDLAPAILALGQLFDAANSVLNEGRATVRVEVRATQAGSFQISFDVAQSLTQQVVSLFSGPEATAAGNLLAYVTAGGAGLIWLVQRLRGSSLQPVEKAVGGKVVLVFEGERLEIPFELLRLYQDLAVRSALQRVIEEPLAKDGIDTFETREDGHVVTRVDKTEAGYFARPSLPDEILVDAVRRSAFSIVSLAFKEDNKWRLFDGSTPIGAAIEDQDFLAKVDANQIAFAKGDILLCDVKVSQRRTTEGLKNEYVVERVVEHRPALRQLPLSFAP